MKAIYEKFHDRGLEIIGISLDQDRKALEKFLAEEKMVWPQRCDGQPWDKSLAQEYGLPGLPTVWLVDKQGVLRHAAVVDGLEEKIEKLL